MQVQIHNTSNIPKNEVFFFCTSSFLLCPISNSVVMQRYRKIEKAVGGGAELCGNGAYGVVYKALDLHTQKVVALKRIKAGTDVNGLRAIALREFTLLKSLQVQMHEILVYLFILNHMHATNRQSDIPTL